MKTAGGHQQEGAALLLVVWVVALLALLAGTALEITSGSGHMAQAALERARMQAATDGAVNLALLQMIDPDPANPWLVDGSPRTLEVGGYSVKVSTRDEAGKVDANHAPDALLRALAATAGRQNGGAAWVEVLERFRGLDSEAGSGSTGAADVQGKVLRSVNEAAVAAAMPDAVYRCLQKDLTVYTGMESIDWRYANAELRRTLATTRTAAADFANEGDGIEISSGQSYAGRVFEIDAEVDVPAGGFEFRRRAVVRITGDADRPALLASWISDDDAERGESARADDCPGRSDQGISR